MPSTASRKSPTQLIAKLSGICGRGKRAPRKGTVAHDMCVEVQKFFDVKKPLVQLKRGRPKGSTGKKQKKRVHPDDVPLIHRLKKKPARSTASKKAVKKKPRVLPAFIRNAGKKKPARSTASKKAKKKPVMATAVGKAVPANEVVIKRLPAPRKAGKKARRTPVKATVLPADTEVVAAIEVNRPQKPRVPPASKKKKKKPKKSTAAKKKAPVVIKKKPKPKKSTAAPVVIKKKKKKRKELKSVETDEGKAIVWRHFVDIIENGDSLEEIFEDLHALADDLNNTIGLMPEKKDVRDLLIDAGAIVADLDPMLNALFDGLGDNAFKRMEDTLKNQRYKKAREEVAKSVNRTIFEIMHNESGTLLKRFPSRPLSLAQEMGMYEHDVNAMFKPMARKGLGFSKETMQFIRDLIWSRVEAGDATPLVAKDVASVPIDEARRLVDMVYKYGAFVK